MTHVQFTPVAAADLQEILDHYLTESGMALAIKFENSWERALRHLSEFPASGSPRLAAKLGIPDLRIWPVPGFPHLVAYSVAKDVVTVQRVLHTLRDIPGSLRE